MSLVLLPNCSLKLLLIFSEKPSLKVLPAFKMNITEPLILEALLVVYKAQL